MSKYDEDAHKKGDPSNVACLEATTAYHEASAKFDIAWELWIKRDGADSTLHKAVERYAAAPEKCDRTGAAMKEASKVLGAAWKKHNATLRALVMVIRHYDKAAMAWDNAADKCSICHEDD